MTPATLSTFYVPQCWGPGPALVCMSRLKTWIQPRNVPIDESRSLIPALLSFNPFSVRQARARRQYHDSTYPPNGPQTGTHPSITEFQPRQYPYRGNPNRGKDGFDP